MSFFGSEGWVDAGILSFGAIRAGVGRGGQPVEPPSEALRRVVLRMGASGFKIEGPIQF